MKFTILAMAALATAKGVNLKWDQETQQALT